ncbi:Ig-like domain repeat protein [Actinoplanes sp. TBRC 11911]|uniref:Ig-like domain-containing protein n=1 Tax=Actinoplanes sp. TBRC 11911 TaxID=2729386 RepID=UPI00145F31D8|nr:Ig-like domain-containing protein [Actinoplanes sp. TBRC 11911]NMO51198.1 Ig-like domain repeat protein [Actinoplanes sp. TBRC 11911]
MNAHDTVRRAAMLAVGVLAGTTLFATAAQAAPVSGPGGLTITPAAGSTTANPIGSSFASANACPEDFRALAQVSLLSDSGAFVPLTNSVFDVADTKLSGPLGVGDSLATAMANYVDGALPSGDYEFALLCYNGDFDFRVGASAPVHVNLEDKTWNVVEGGGETGAVATTTTLTADPTNAKAGDDVTLTATVGGEGAAGSVEYFDGGNSLGTVAVSGGTATKTVDTLSAGDHSLTAKFEPTDPDAFKESTSDAVTVKVTAEDGSSTGGQQINVTVPSIGGGNGSLTMEVGSDPVTLDQVAEGQLSFKGDLSEITVTDERDQLAGWHVDGTTSDFTGDNGTIAAKQLGWAPKVVEQNEKADVVKGADVTPAAPGLANAATLASAAAGKGAGSATLGGTLDLEVPAEAAAGSYSADLTVTLMGSPS